MKDRVYAVRTSEDFATQAEAAFDWLEQKINFDTAEEWRVGLQKAKAALATLPARCVVADEDQFYQKSTPAHRCGFHLPMTLPLSCSISFATAPETH